MYQGYHFTLTNRYYSHTLRDNTYSFHLGLRPEESMDSRGNIWWFSCIINMYYMVLICVFWFMCEGRTPYKDNDLHVKPITSCCCCCYHIHERRYTIACYGKEITKKSQDLGTIYWTIAWGEGSMLTAFTCTALMLRSINHTVIPLFFCYFQVTEDTLCASLYSTRGRHQSDHWKPCPGFIDRIWASPTQMKRVNIRKSYNHRGIWLPWYAWY